MKRVYLCAGLYAEGRTDYAFLLPLINRLLDDLCARLLPSAHERADSKGIDAEGSPPTDRAQRIALAIEQSVSECTLFVIHSDGESDHALHQQRKIDPGVQAAKARVDEPFAAAPCLPVRETESWLLTDLRPFQLRYGEGISLTLPAQPEKEADPKLTARQLMQLAGKSSHLPTESQLGELMPLFGDNVSLECLRRLPSFRAFEAELIEAVREVAAEYGHLI